MYSYCRGRGHCSCCGIGWASPNPTCPARTVFVCEFSRMVRGGGQSKQLARLLTRELDSLLSQVRGISSGPTRGSLPASQPGPAEQGSRTAGAEARLSSVAVAVASQAVKTKPNLEVTPITSIRTDLYGATTPVTALSMKIEEGVYKNVDGHRFEDGRYKAFVEEINSFMPKERQFTDPVRTFAYGTDASFYRLNPKLVVKVLNEGEIRRILPIAAKHEVPVTFRAAGTSLSGQALTDSVLLKLSHTGKHFRGYTVHVSALAARPCRALPGTPHACTHPHAHGMHPAGDGARGLGGMGVMRGGGGGRPGSMCVGLWVGG